MTDMKQKKLEVSCPRRRQLKRTKQHGDNFFHEKGGTHETNSDSHRQIKGEHIIVPAATLETDTAREDLGITESDELKKKDHQVIFDGNIESKQSERINGSFGDTDIVTDQLEADEGENSSNGELLQSELSEVQSNEISGSTSDTHLTTQTEKTEYSGRLSKEKPRESEKLSLHSSSQNYVEDLAEENSSPKIKETDKTAEMKGNKKDLKTIEEESDERADTRNSNSSSSNKLFKKGRNTQLNRSGSALARSSRNASSRHSFSCVEDRKSPFKENIYSLRRSHSAMERPKSKVRGSFSDPFKFTKAELEWHLPRKSFFDCHDKALKEAGVESASTTNRIEQMKQRVADKIKKEKELREKRKQLENPVPKEEAVDNTATPGENTAIQDNKSENGSEMDKNEIDDNVIISKLEATQTIVSKSRKHTRHKKKAHDDNEDDVRVDYQPLLQYLRYVKEHPEEFYSHRKQMSQQDHVGSRASPWIIRLAQITERRNLSSAQCLMSKSVVLEAARDIRPRTTDPGQWTMSQKERALLGNMNLGKSSVFIAVKQDLPTHDSQNQDDGKSDFEKEKLKLEKWLKTVSTAGLLKAKELALRELGEEDSYQTKWWSTLQTCTYLRQTGINSS